VEVSGPTEGADASLPEIAVLRDGAVGATRWAFAALAVMLAQKGHCTLVRTRTRRWLRTGSVVRVEFHADPTTLTSFEQTVLRQLGRHDTLNGFGFAGSTFRRRTLRDVRADLVERGWLVDRHRRSNVCLLLGLALLGSAFVAGWGSVVGTAIAGGGTGGLLAATRRYPLTATGARLRAAHRAYAQRQHKRLRACLPGAPERAAVLWEDVLPHLILERIVTPRRLNVLADAVEEAGCARPVPDWMQDDIEESVTVADGCRTLSHVLAALGAVPVAERVR
jgi:hypothetical protein